MAYVMFNPNPNGLYVGDCTVRAISKITGQDWDTTYIALAVNGFMLKDMPSSNHVWGSYLKSKGYHRYVLPDTCPDCYSVKDFCYDNPKGKYILATGSHVIASEDGSYYDSWDSGDEAIVYFWTKEG